MNFTNIDKKVVLVTGGARGLGRSFALKFARNKWAVALNYRQSEGAAEDVCREVLSTGGFCKRFRADVSSSEDVKKMMSGIESEFGRLDAVVNNAACIRDRTILKMSDVEWQEVIDTDLKGAFYILRESVSFMIKKKICGSIINISSIAGVRGNFGEANYSAAKGGLIALTKTAAREVGRRGICVNCVLPGFHLTDMGRSAGEEYYKKNLDQSVLHTTTSVEELSDFIVFLAGLKTVSGQVFNIDSRVL